MTRSAASLAASSTNALTDFRVAEAASRIRSAASGSARSSSLAVRVGVMEIL
jgi:hypothetical protein